MIDVIDAAVGPAPIPTKCKRLLQLAARHPTLVDALCLIAAAGLPRRRSIASRLKVKSKVALYKTLRALPIGDKDRLRERFGAVKEDDKNAILRKASVTLLKSGNTVQQHNLKSRAVYASASSTTLKTFCAIAAERLI